MNTSTQEQVKTKVPAGVAVLVVSAVLLGVAGAGYMLMNAGVPKASKRTSNTTNTTTNTPVNTNAASMSMSSLTTATTNGIWITPAELAAIPITGEAGCLTGSACAAAWNRIVTAANAPWEASNGPNGCKVTATSNFPIDLTNQNSSCATYAVAAALVYARTGDAALRAKARDAIIKAKRTLDEDAEYRSELCVNNLCYGQYHKGQACTTHTECWDPALAKLSVLSVGRQLVGYTIAADLINLPNFPDDPNTPLVDEHAFNNDEFVPWLRAIRNQELLTSNAIYGKTLVRANESTNTWGLAAGASRIAIDRYLSDTSELDRSYAVFRAHSDRSKFPDNVWYYPGVIGGNEGYFIRQGSYEPTWICGDTTNWLTISPDCIKDEANSPPPSVYPSPPQCVGPDATIVSANIEGAIVTETPRCVAGQRPEPFNWPPYPDGLMYHWTSFNGLFLQAEMLYRGGYPDAYTFGNSALKRSMDFLVRAGNPTPQYSSMRWIPWVANKRFGTSFTTEANVVPAWSMSWTDWTHQRLAETTPPTGVNNVSPANGSTGISWDPTLTATTASDPSTPVSYFFELYSGSLCTGTPTQTRPYSAVTTWIPTSPLNPSTTYAWRNKARDNAATPNESAFGPCWIFTTRSSGGGGGGCSDPPCEMETL